jgi:hypothetical protein
MFNMRSPALNQANGTGLPVPWFERRRTPPIPELAPKIQSPAPDPKKPAICLEVTQSPAILFRIMNSMDAARCLRGNLDRFSGESKPFLVAKL